MTRKKKTSIQNYMEQNNYDFKETVQGGVNSEYI